MNCERENRINLNEHQFSALAESSKEEMELLFEVILSCIDGKLCDYGCANLRSVMKEL